LVPYLVLKDQPQNSVKTLFQGFNGRECFITSFLFELKVIIKTREKQSFSVDRD